MDAYSVREKQGLVPDLQIDDPHYELKGIRVDSSNASQLQRWAPQHRVRSTGPVSPSQERARHRQVDGGWRRSKAASGEAGP
jgi:hypothetical protein